MAKKPPLSEIIRKSVLKNIDKDTYLDLKNPPQVECIRVGSIIVEKVIGLQGIPRGRITEIYGAESSGKTTVATAIAAECQKAGGHVAYLDFEQAFHLGYAKDQGLDTDDDATFALFQPKTFEEGWAITRELIDKGIDLLILDSVSGMIPKKILNAEIDKEAQPGVLAKMMSQYVSEVTKKINDSKTAFVFINQIRSRIKMNMFDTGPDQDTSGGKALKFYASIRLELVKRKTEHEKGKNPLDGTEEDIPINNIVTCINRKNKLALPYKKADFVIRLGEGIDNKRSICDIAINLNIIKKEAGGWYAPKKGLVWQFDAEFMDKEGKVHGIEGLRKYMIKYPDAFDKVVESIFINPDKNVEDESKAEEVDIDSLAEKAAAEVAAAKPKRGRMKKEDKKAILELAEVSIDSVPGAEVE